MREKDCVLPTRPSLRRSQKPPRPRRPVTPWLFFQAKRSCAHPGYDPRRKFLFIKPVGDLAPCEQRPNNSFIVLLEMLEQKELFKLLHRYAEGLRRGAVADQIGSGNVGAYRINVEPQGKRIEQFSGR